MGQANLESENSLVVVLREDRYETQFGDGYFAYFDAVFKTPESAAAYVTTKTTKDTAYHLRNIRLIVRQDRIFIEGTLAENEQITPAQVVKALASDHQ
ncbi:MAG TPA: hypothetical protein PKO06_22925 [Candidatus Ozemobacteraceae bacterium]|mgnify:CR=1 FL=1|nr:hypothetical protein [Candidatus Ozemobacteraceae bacterium]